VFQKFMAKLLEHEKVKPLLSDEHFSVDGTLIEAWASHKSFKPKRSKDGDVLELSRSGAQERHASKHDRSEAKLYRKADGREVLGASTITRSPTWLTSYPGIGVARSLSIAPPDPAAAGSCNPN